jgi:hypothetical protein
MLCIPKEGTAYAPRRTFLDLNPEQLTKNVSAGTNEVADLFLGRQNRNPVPIGGVITRNVRTAAAQADSKNAQLTGVNRRVDVCRDGGGHAV